VSAKAFDHIVKDLLPELLAPDSHPPREQPGSSVGQESEHLSR
jgi:hypothetical protein